MSRIVLASQSPSRAAILRAAGVDPLLRPAHVDEEAIAASLPGAEPSRVVCALARAKAQKIAPDYPADVVIGADSMLLLGGELQGKPHTRDRALERWGRQAGRSAQLVTGHFLRYGERTFQEATATTVHFADAAAADVAAYVDSGEPLECAGAFTLEALGAWFIDGIEGDPSSVVGLSLPLVRRALYSFGLSLREFWSAGADPR